jgi:hypothetical protein
LKASSSSSSFISFFLLIIIIIIFLICKKKILNCDEKELERRVLFYSSTNDLFSASKDKSVAGSKSSSWIIF